MTNPLTDEKLEAARAWAKALRVPPPWHLRAADGTRDTLEIADLVAEIDRLHTALATAKREAEEAKGQVDQLAALVYVPGQLRCAKCGFVCQKMLLDASSGRVGVDTRFTTEPCPNGCGPLWRMTERQAGNDLCDRLEKMFDELQAAREAMGKVSAVLPRLADGMEHDDPECPGDDTCRCPFVAEVNAACALAALRESKESDR